MARRIRAHDWTATPLGPVEAWPQSLRTAIDILLSSGFPTIALWGEDLVQIYNDRYRDLMGFKHPAGLGQPTRECWPEVWHINKPIYERVWAGETLTFEDALFPIIRSGRLEDAWFTLTYGALRDDGDRVAGVLVSVFETTERVRTALRLRENEERQAFLLKLSDALRAIADPVQIQEEALRLLGENLEAGWVYYGEFDADVAHMIVRADYRRGDEPSLVGSCPVASFGILQELSAGRTTVIHDTLNSPIFSEASRAQWGSRGMRSVIAVPIMKDGTLISALAVADTEPRDWTRDIASIEETAQRTWAAVERARAEMARRESESRFRALATAGAYMMYRMSADWRHMHQLEGRDFLADTTSPVENWADTYLLPEDQPEIFAAIDRAIRTKSLFELEHRVRLADGGVGWVLSRAVPILGPDGEIAEWFGAGSDVTAKREVEAKLREAEERHRGELERQVRERTAELKANRDLLQATMDASTDMIQVFEAIRNGSGEIVDFRWVLNNHTSESRYGKVEGESLLTRNPGVVQEEIFDTFKRVTETGEPGQAERYYIHEQFDGWFYQSVVKLGDGVATTTKDITEWKQAQDEVLRLQEEIAQAKLRESEERFRLIVESARDYAIFTTDLNGIITEWPPGAQAVLGGTPDEMVGRSMDMTFLPEYISKGDPEHERREAREKGHAPNVRWHRRIDGARVFISGSTRLLRDAKGLPVGYLKIGQDITERKRSEEALRESEERLKVMVAELQHRTRNLIAVVRSIAQQTMAMTGPSEEFREQFYDRLAALARVQGLFSHSDEGPITIETLVRMELDALGVLQEAGDRIEIVGPPVPIRPSVVQTLALALHELATNARKHGALATKRGRLRVAWLVEDGNGEGCRLRLEWVESGTALTSEADSARRGYGRELIERALPHTLGARTSYELNADGVRCSIDMPLDKRERQHRRQ
ncbi:PAS domain S-box protein [Microvirga sp. 2YAF29]|uniref:PAS domain S-box protein n=1 Tax=Microvirga sp. 2YAF29 TaxID=3233031 RepID=UPI003F9AE450